MHTAVVDTALQLTIALILVRLGVYLLRLSLGGDGWIARLGNAADVAHLAARRASSCSAGSTTPKRTLDSIDLIPGKAQFSLWALLKGIVVVIGFVLMSRA